MSKEYIEGVFQKFENHLNLENNNRIIFSGKFGLGKSYFLNEFFKEEGDEKKYFSIFLNPVNYSIASNEDIFELIKFDILYQILDKDIVKFDDFDFPKGNLLFQYFSNKFFNDFLSTIDLIGEKIIDEVPGKPYNLLKKMGKLFSRLEEIGKADYKNFEMEISKNPDLMIINKFFEDSIQRTGTQYERNFITELIFQLVKNIEENSLKTILIIDDLDRIDPEHIFRILNIFSAHDKLDENKFGFEKVILVCDINNIKHIYHHFYGENVDFYGYINKFYSLEVYLYKNKDYLLAFGKDFNLNGISRSVQPFIQFIIHLFSEAIKNNYITARQLFNTDFSLDNILYQYNSFTKIGSGNINFKGKLISDFSPFLDAYALTKTLIYFFGDKQILLSFVNSIDKNVLIYSRKILAQLLIFSDNDLKKPGENINFSVRNISMKTNNYSEVEITENLQIQSLDLKEMFKDILDNISNIISK